MDNDGAIFGILLERDGFTIDLVHLEGVLDSELVQFASTTVHDEDSLVLEPLPREYLRSRVEESVLADGVVGDVDLGVTAGEGEFAAVLGDAEDAVGGGELDGVLGGFGALVVGVADDEEVAVLALGGEEGRDGDGHVVAVFGGGGGRGRGGEVAGGDAHELGFEFDFGVFLAVNVAVLTDGLGC